MILNENFPNRAKNFIQNRPSLSIDYDVPSKKHGFYAFVVNLDVGEFRGRCCLKEIDIGLLETHSRLDPQLCGRGFGVVMYSAAIRFAVQAGFRVCSSPHRDMTVDARRVWESQDLNKSFRIYKDFDRFRVIK